MSASEPSERGGLRGGLLGHFERLAVFPGSVLHAGKACPVKRSEGLDARRLVTARLHEQITLLTAGSRGPAGGGGAPIHLLLFYGNGSCLAEFRETIGIFRDLGCTVYVPEYVGYGDSSGQASYEGCLDTAETAFRNVRRHIGGTPGKLVVAGWSLGAAMAIHLASRPEVAGLIALAPFTSIRDMADQRFSRWLPIRHLVGDHFHNNRAIRKVTVPMLIAHGSRDRVVPLKMGEELARTAIHYGNLKVTFQKIDGAGHTDLFDPRFANFRYALRDFLGQISGVHPSSGLAHALSKSEEQDDEQFGAGQLAAAHLAASHAARQHRGGHHGAGHHGSDHHDDGHHGAGSHGGGHDTGGHHDAGHGVTSHASHHGAGSSHGAGSHGAGGHHEPAHPPSAGHHAGHGDSHHKAPAASPHGAHHGGHH